MKESMLHEFYFGINPCERKRVRDPEYTAICKKIDNLDLRFKNLLSAEEYAKLEEMQNLRAQASLFEEAQLFEYAFSIGALLMIDVFGFNRQS